MLRVGSEQAILITGSAIIRESIKIGYNKHSSRNLLYILEMYVVIYKEFLR
jgi:hypothetical protein